MLKSTFLERAIHTGVERVMGLVSPSAALKRNYERKVYEFAYDAAQPGRARGQGTGITNKSPESLRNQQDRVRMMWGYSRPSRITSR
jgi:hypothetical protein